MANMYNYWVEPSVIVRWWNPLTWIARAFFEQRWYLMRDFGRRSSWAISIGYYSTRKAAEAAKEQDHGR